MALASASQCLFEAFEVSQIGASQRSGIEQDLLVAAFQRPKHGAVLKGKVDLVIVEDLKDNYLLMVAAEHAKVLDDRLDISEAIREEDHQPSATADTENLLKGGSQIGFSSALGACQRFHEGPQMARANSGWNLDSDARVEGDNTDCVLLGCEQVGQTCCESDCIFVFAESVASGSGITHRVALVDEQRCAQIGFVLVLPNIESVGLAVYFPVDRADLVPVNVRPMLFEVDAGTDVTRTMHAAAEPVDDTPREPLELGYAGEFLGSQPTKQRVGKQGRTCGGSDETIIGLVHL